MNAGNLGEMFKEIFAGAGLVWDTADLAQGLMVVTNVPSILILGGIACRCLKDYQKQKKAGLNPTFKAADINLKQDTDFWK